MRRRYNRLTATTAEIVIPRTRDCLDILLSGNSLSTLERNYEGVFFTDSWLDFTRNSPLDLDKLEAERGKEGAAKFIKTVRPHQSVLHYRHRLL